MNQLPELVLIEILKNLPIYDQINCRRVCKSIKAIAERILVTRSTELVLIHELDSIPLIWLHNNKKIDLNNSIIVNRRFIRSSFFKEIFQNIQNLCIVFFSQLFENHQRGFNELINHFKKLKHLQIESLRIVPEKQLRSREFVKNPIIKVDFNLPNLKSLFINHPCELIALNCPNLEQLSADANFYMDENLSSFKDSLKLLKVKLFSNDDYEMTKLETLYYSNSRIELEKFPKLNKINYYYRNDYSNIMSYYSFYQKSRETILSELLGQKIVLKKKKLKIYENGVHLLANHRFGELKKLCSFSADPLFGSSIFELELSDNELENYLMNPREFNYEHLRHFLVWTNRTSGVLEAMKDRSIESIGKSIVSVAIREMNNEDLKSLKMKNLLKNVRLLIINDMSQDQLNSLPEIVPNATEIVVKFKLSTPKFADPTNYLKLNNFSFLTEFRCLKSLFIHQLFISLNLLNDILDECKFFAYLKVTFGGHYVVQSEMRLKKLFTGSYETSFDTKKPKSKFGRMENCIWETKEQVLDYLERENLFEEHFNNDLSKYNFYLLLRTCDLVEGFF